MGEDREKEREEREKERRENEIERRETERQTKKEGDILNSKCLKKKEDP